MNTSLLISLTKPTQGWNFDKPPTNCPWDKLPVFLLTSEQIYSDKGSNTANILYYIIQNIAALMYDSI